jgi:hypothetical protein
MKMSSSDAKKAATETVAQKINLSSIRFGIDGEIDEALTRYCRDELRLSKVYWPSAFRALVMNILGSLLDKPQTWSELCTPTMTVNSQLLQLLIDELKFPTSKHIKVKHRRWITHLLREVSLFRRKFGLSARRPRMLGDSNNWPEDLEDKDDLSSSMTDISLRDDIRDYIWRVLDEVVPFNKYCNLHYYGAIRTLKSDCPIAIEVPDDMIEVVKHRITTVSDRLRVSNFENLLPSDLIELKGVPTREVVAAIDEGFCTSGSPWKEGTVGGILQYGNRFIGITSGHVHRKSVESFDASDVDRSARRFIDAKVDVAFFTFRDGGATSFNSLPMQYIGSMLAVDLKIGESVYKVGRSSGLTVGKLGSIHSSPRIPGGRYEDHVQVLWNDDGCSFAVSMDCGSLYCVQRGPVYVPIAIHRTSDANHSYGCSLWKAMEYFTEDSEIFEDVGIVNASI